MSPPAAAPAKTDPPRVAAPEDFIDNADAAQPSRRWLLIAGTLYLCFTLYGSLVPLQYRPLPWASAISAFQSIRWLDLGIGARADWVANILLFIPLSFLWCGIVWPWRRRWLRIPAAALMLAACAGLAVGLEFTQVFFPPRTVSLNDIAAEAIGAAIGIGLWVATGARLTRWMQTLPLVNSRAGLAERALAVYLLVLFTYNLLPFDLTISPVEIFHKWRGGKVLLLPFSATYASAALRAYDILSDIAVWIPAAWLWRSAFRTPVLRTWTAAATAASLLEFMQLFVHSRVTDVTDILTAGLGAAIGAGLAGLAGPGAQSASAVGRPPAVAAALLPWLLALAGWLAVLATVFWYPFDFDLDPGGVRARLQGLRRLPLEALYAGSEFRAVVEVLRKTGFMLPLGIVLAGLGRVLGCRMPGPTVHCLAVAFVVATAMTIEGVQLLLPSRVSDLTDVALETIGGLIGYVLFVAAAGRAAGASARS